MIKIAFVIDRMFSPTGGTESQLIKLIENIDRSMFIPYLYVLRSTRWLEESYSLSPVKVLGVDSFKQSSLPIRFYHLVKSLRQEKIDVVHCFFRDGSWFGIPAAKIAGVPLIVAARRNQGYWMKGTDLLITKLLNRYVDLMVANAVDTKRWTTSIESFPEEKISVIYNGIDIDLFSQENPRNYEILRQELGIPLHAPVVGLVANLRPVKDIETFIRAAKEVKKKLESVHFVIVGEGELLDTLKAITNELNIERSVHFLGSRDDIPTLLSIFKLGVLSSISESFSNTIIEYMAAGLPVVCTDVGGVREAIEDGVNGFVVPPGDVKELSNRMFYVLSDDSLMADMGEKNRAKAASFSLSNMIQKHQNLYSEALLGRRYK